MTPVSTIVGWIVVSPSFFTRSMFKTFDKLADLLSRIGAPASGSYDPTLPAKFQALVKFLPKSIKAIKTIRVYANKDIYS